MPHSLLTKVKEEVSLSDRVTFRRHGLPMRLWKRSSGATPAAEDLPRLPVGPLTGPVNPDLIIHDGVRFVPLADVSTADLKGESVRRRDDAARILSGGFSGQHFAAADRLRVEADLIDVEVECRLRRQMRP